MVLYRYVVCKAYLQHVFGHWIVLMLTTRSLCSMYEDCTYRSGYPDALVQVLLV